MAPWRKYALVLLVLCGAVVVSSAAAPQELLPSSGLVAGWTMTEPTRSYGPNNLWEYIDGNADLFLSYGFVDLAVGDFHPAVGEGWISVDIYDMGTPLNAFGIFQTERPEEVKLSSLGAQGYTFEGLSAYWKGPYYVKVALIEGKNTAAAQQLAESTAARIPDDPNALKAFDRLPLKDRIVGSERYLKKNALGHSWLNEVVSAQYRIQGAKEQGTLATLSLADLATTEKAAEGYTKLRKYQSGTAKINDYRGSWEAAFATKDPYNGETFVAHKGQFLIIGRSEQGTREAVARLVKAAVQHLTATKP
jgi:hypothetical protein